MPQIAKTKQINEVEWLHGTYHATWIFWKSRGKVITEALPRRSILYAPVTFTKSMRLKNADVLILKQKYTQAEFV